MTRSSAQSFNQAYQLNLNSSRVLIGLMVLVAAFEWFSNPALFDEAPFLIGLFSWLNIGLGLLIVLLSFSVPRIRENFFLFTVAYLFFPFVGLCLRLNYTEFGDTFSFMLVCFALVTPWYFMRQTHLILFQVFMILGVILTVLVTPASQPDSNLFLYAFIAINLVTFLLANSKIGSLHRLLQSSEESLSFAHHLKEGLIQVDSNFNIIHINAYLGKLLERDVEPYIGRFVVTEVVPKEFQSSMIARMMGTGKETGNHVPIELLHAAGHPIPFQMSISPRLDLDNQLQGYNLLLVDMRSHLEKVAQIEQDSLQLEKKLRDANAKKMELERFASKIANDLRSPLEVINRGVQILASMNVAEEPIFQDSMEEIENNVGRVYEIMQAVLLYSVTDVTQMKPRLLDLNLVLSEVRSSLAPLLEANDVTVDYDPMPKIYADKIQMLRLFRNFIESSITRRGNLTPAIYLSYTQDKGKGMYVFSLQDNGMGISREDYDNIFRIFQEEETPDVDANSIGFGLSICNKIVNNHGGKLWFTSNAGKGTTFHFSLPVAQPEQVPS